MVHNWGAEQGERTKELSSFDKAGQFGVQVPHQSLHHVFVHCAPLLWQTASLTAIRLGRVNLVEESLQDEIRSDCTLERRLARVRISEFKGVSIL